MNRHRELQTWSGAVERLKLFSLYSPLSLLLLSLCSLRDSLPSVLLSAARASSQEMNGGSQRTVVLANDLPRSHDPLNVGWAGGWRLPKQREDNILWALTVCIELHRAPCGRFLTRLLRSLPLRATGVEACSSTSPLEEEGGESHKKRKER